MKKQHSARPMMTLAVLALVLYKLLLGPASINASNAVTSPPLQTLSGYMTYMGPAN